MTPPTSQARAVRDSIKAFDAADAAKARVEEDYAATNDAMQAAALELVNEPGDYDSWALGYDAAEADAAAEVERLKEQLARAQANATCYAEMLSKPTRAVVVSDEELRELAGIFRWRADAGELQKMRALIATWGAAPLVLSDDDCYEIHSAGNNAFTFDRAKFRAVLGQHIGRTVLAPVPTPGAGRAG